MDILSNLAELSDDRLAEYRDEVRAAFDAIAELPTPTREQIEEAEAYADHLEVVAAEQTRRTEEAADLAARAAALRDRFSDTDDEAEPGPDPEPEPEPQPEPESEAEVIEITQVEEQPPARVAAIARRTTRPPAPAPSRYSPVAITAAADVPQIPSGSDLGTDLEKVSTALVNRMRGFGTPSGDGENENLQHYGVAYLKLDFPEELTIDRHSDDMEVLTLAGKESRLPGNSLVAAGGWCAPSETLYDLCAGETAEGILSVPEVNVKRGGIKYTSGPDFASIYSAAGFCQTEAQAISGTAKTCVEVPCPSFTEVRLDVCGLCVKAPILTNAAYPELVQRYISGSLIAHQHKMNARVVAAMATSAGTAKTVTALGSTAADTLGSLELIADGVRSKYRLSMGHTLEVVVPFWVKGAIRSDLRNRSGQDSPVSDSQISAEFGARNLSVQFVYDWQDTPFPAGTAPAVSYPTTFQALMYPAGTFIKGTSDVINLNAVYDAASLATNIYTALFFEEGILVAKMCYEAQLVTIPVCNAGNAGALDLNCA